MERYEIMFTMGFRAFFPAAALWAAGAMVIWLGALTSHIAMSDSLTWHAHEFLFGYTSAVLAGFLLTAIPNWTNRPAVQGMPLAGLFALWLAGRVVMLETELVGGLFAAIVDGGFLFTLVAVAGRELVAARNIRNLPVLAMVAAVGMANAGFHVEVSLVGSGDISIRAGLSLILTLIMLIGGRIIPTFTRNWLMDRGPGLLPRPFAVFDRIAILSAAVALVGWVAWPDHATTGGALVLAGLLHLIRCARWAGHRTASEPLLAVLHFAYLFIPAGFFAVGSTILSPGSLDTGSALHFWTAGAVGLMTTAVMTRAALGHTGAPLTANMHLKFVFGALILSAMTRCLSGFAAEPAFVQSLSALTWIGGFFWLSAVLAWRVAKSSGTSD
jgi:uncharacterized protein involved in response to NO